MLDETASETKPIVTPILETTPLQSSLLHSMSPATASMPVAVYQSPPLDQMTSCDETSHLDHLECLWRTSSILSRPLARVPSPITLLMISLLLFILTAGSLVSAVVSMVSAAVSWIFGIVSPAPSVVSWIIDAVSPTFGTAHHVFNVISATLAAAQSNAQSFIADSWRTCASIGDLVQIASERLGTLSKLLSSKDPPLFIISGLLSLLSHCCFADVSNHGPHTSGAWFEKELDIRCSSVPPSFVRPPDWILPIFGLLVTAFSCPLRRFDDIGWSCRRYHMAAVGPRGGLRVLAGFLPSESCSFDPRSNQGWLASKRPEEMSRLVWLVHLMLSLSPTSIKAHSTPLETLRDTFEARRATLEATKTPPLSVGILPSLVLPPMRLGPVSLCFALPDDPRSSCIEP